MDGLKDEIPSSNGSLLPPVVTRRKSFRSSASQPAPLAPPYIAGSKTKPVEPPIEVKAPIESIEPPAEAEAAAEPMMEASIEAFAPTDATEEEGRREMFWDSTDEGVVEPAFTADTDALLEALSQDAAEALAAAREEFPLEAFIVPEQAQHVPSGLEGMPLTQRPESTPLTSLAERLEKLSHRLRVEETEAVVRRLAAGDRLDTLLAGLLAGYLAGSSEQQRD